MQEDTDPKLAIIICDPMGQNQSHVAIFSYEVKYTTF